MFAEKLKELIEKLPITLILLGYLGFLAFDFYTFQSDPGSPLIMKKKELDTTKELKTKLDAKIKENELFVKTLEVKKKELRGLAQELQGTKEGLAERTDVPAFMKMMITEAKKIGLRVQSIKPGGTSEKEYYAETKFTMTFQGVFVQVATFVDRITNVAEIVKVDEFTLKPVGTGQDKIVLLDAVFQLNTFNYMRSNADNLGTDRPGVGANAPKNTGAGP